MREGSVTGGKESIHKKSSWSGQGRPRPRVHHLLHLQHLLRLEHISTIIEQGQLVAHNNLASVQGLQVAISLGKPVKKSRLALYFSRQQLKEFLSKIEDADLNMTWLAVREMSPEWAVTTSKKMLGLAMERSSQPRNWKEINSTKNEHNSNRIHICIVVIIILLLLLS